MAVAQLDLVVAMFGVSPTVVGGYGEGCLVKFGGGRTGALDATGRLELRDVSPETASAGWDDRWEGSARAGDIFVLDVPAKWRTRIVHAIGNEVSDGCCAHAGRLWIGGYQGVTSVSLAQLEAIATTKQPDVRVVIRFVYPMRNAAVAQPARVAWVFDNGEALVNIGTRQIRVPGAGLEKSTDIVLRDELHAGVYAMAERADGTRVTLIDVDARREHVSRVARSTQREPAAPVVYTAITSSDPRLPPLVAEWGREPENEANRLVLVDLLQELGATLAEPRRKRAGLGPLAEYLDDVEFRHGLPWSAVLVRKPPLERESVARVASDVRLGLLAMLRLGRGPIEVYLKLVGSPHAVNLRHVDINDASVARALIARGHTAVTHAFDVRFTKNDLLRELASEELAGVTEIDTVVQRQHVQGLLDRVCKDAHGLFARAPRRLVVREQHHYEIELVVPALQRFSEMPVSELWIGPLSLRKRDDGRIAAHLVSTPASPYYVNHVAAALPAGQVVGITTTDEATRVHLRERYPALVMA